MYKEKFAAVRSNKVVQGNLFIQFIVVETHMVATGLF